MTLDELVRKIVREEIQNALGGGISPEAIRHMAHLSRQQLAELAGVSAETIGRLERGQFKHVKPRILQALARALKREDYIGVVLAARKPDFEKSRKRRPIGSAE